MRRKMELIGIAFNVVCLFAASTAQAKPQADFLITSPNTDTIERFDAFTGEYLGAFVTAGSGGLDSPGGVAVGPDNNVYVNSSMTQQVLRYDGGTGAFIDVFASGNGLIANNNIRFHGDYMYVGQFASGGNGFIKRFDASTGAFVDNFITANFIDGFEFGSDSIYVSDFSGGVSEFDIIDGSFIQQIAARNEGGLINPTAILQLENDDLLISSYGTSEVKRFSSNGDYLGDVITGLAQPEGLAIGPNGNLYAGSYSQGIVNEYDINDFGFVREFASNGSVTNFFTFRTTAVPEPSGMIPLLAGILLAVTKRRRKLAESD